MLNQIDPFIPGPGHPFELSGEQTEQGNSKDFKKQLNDIVFRYQNLAYLMWLDYDSPKID